MLELLRQMVTWLRDTYKDELVLVTAAENFQIRERGWSVESWHQRIVVRNYLSANQPLRLSVPDLADY